MKTRKQKALFRKSLNKVYPCAIGILDDETIVNGALYTFRSNRKTFKLGINPVKKKKKEKAE